jgi:hypothetical protein
MSAVTTGSAARSASPAQIDVIGLAVVGSNPQAGARTDRVIETPAPRLQKEGDIVDLRPLLEVLATGSDQPPGDLKAQLGEAPCRRQLPMRPFPSDSDVSAQLNGRSAT